ncbi:Fc receptor-like protein 2 isoform X2 [Tachysurus fulvidraco]|uniref:Fc receptor-like protein 2 isoform X2 n=1 Tax=Tachysurus fulvidraco TaxID=1234273 RepID=UPI001FED7163|nr:Fc receptor-like protein 2 isoform X2 [Tachysurus fulvidraco]
MMSLKPSSLLCLIFLLMIPALGNEWSVKYSQLNLCALKGSTVIMNVTYTHPPRLTVTKRFWLINPVQGKESTDLNNVPGYSGRVTYITDVQNHFHLRLSDVKKTDEQMYYFRIRTNTAGQRYQGDPGVTLSVTDLDLQIAPAEVTEGQSVVLTCKTTCSLTDPTFIWYKNSRDLTTKTNKNNKVRLQSVSSADAGSYSCAVRGYEHLHSPVQTLSVRSLGNKWSVKYSQLNLCALKGSTVIMNVTYTHPPRLTVTQRFWVINPVKGKVPTDLCNEPGYSGRVTYITDVQNHFPLSLSDVKKTDEQMYCFRIITNKKGQRYQGDPGVTLSVTGLDLQIAPAEVTEGQSVVLTCKTTCSLTDPTFIWYKNSRDLTTKTNKNNEVRLQSVSSEDAGSYSCAVRGYEHLHSPVQTLRVRSLGNEWSVKYSQLNLCALKGSTVIMDVTYTHPPRLIVTQRFWFINPAQGKEPNDLCNEPGYSGRVTYLTDVQNHFPLSLSDVKKTDEQKYCFRIITNTEGQRYLGYPGVTLSVTDLDLQIAPAEVTEGQSVVLTCKTTCSLTDPTFIWYKNSRDLTTNTNKNNEVRLQSVSSEDAGSYSCAVRGYEHLHSPVQTLRVRYPPKNVSVSISPSGEIVEDSSVNLTCSSDANPPVQNYTWFKVKESSPVGSGQSYRAVQSGQYYCEAQNKHGSERSAAVSVTNYDSLSSSVYAGLCGVLVVFICLTVTFLCIRKKKTGSTAGQSLNQENLYENIAVTNPDNTVSDSASANQDDVLYASVVHQRAVDPRTAESSAVKASASEEVEVQYASVSIKRRFKDF